MRVGVYGLGRFGRFWTELLSSTGLDVYVGNRNPRQAPPSATFGELKFLCQLDAIFLCTSISSIGSIAAEIAPLLSPETLVMDTCSVKLYPLKELNRHLSDKQAILGTHPLFGPDSVHEKNLPIVLSPWRVEQKQLDLWTAIFTAAGMKVINMTANVHDRQVARTQAVTHFIGRFLSSLELKQSRISTLGFQKLFDVMEQTCNDPLQLFKDLHCYNPYTTEVRKEMQIRFNEIIQLLDNLPERE